MGFFKGIFGICEEGVNIVVNDPGVWAYIITQAPEQTHTIIFINDSLVWNMLIRGRELRAMF